MKKLLFILLLLPTWLLAQVTPTSGIKVATPLIKNSVTDNTITGYAELLNGGYHTGLTYHSRDSINTYFTKSLRTGMIYYVSGVDSTYRWNGSTWNPVVFSPTLTFSNGITKLGSTVKLGGNLTQSITQVGLNGNNFLFSGNASQLTLSDISGVPNIFGYVLNASGAESLLSLAGYGLNGNEFSITDNGTVNKAGIFMEQTSVSGLPSTLMVKDAIGSFGMAYSADYSTNGSASSRWIPDLGYISSHFATIGGGTTTNALTNGYGVQTFSFNGGTSGITVKADSTVLVSLPRLATNLTGYLKKTGLTATTPLAYNSGTGAISIQVANTSQSGYLTGTDWNTFNSKVASVTASGNIASSGGTTPNITFTGLLPVANGGTGTATPGIVAGTNITVTGTWPNQTVNASASGLTGSGTTGYIPKFTSSSALGNSLIQDNGTYISVPQLILNTTSQPSTNSIVWFGDSITFGYSLTTTADRFSSRISSALGYTENNQGTNGLTAQAVASGNTITTHVAGMQYLVIELGTNDLNGGRTTTQIQADISTIIGQAIAKGWTSAQIRVCSLFGFQTFSSSANIIAFDTAISAAVTASGGTYVDCYYSILTGTPYGNLVNMTADGVHPNDNYGSPAITNVLISQFANIFTAASQGALIQTADIANLKVKNYTQQSKGTPLAVDSLGNVFPLLGFQDKQRFLGNAWFDKAIIQSNRGASLGTPFGVNSSGLPSYAPTTFSSTNDFALTFTGAKLWSAYQSSLYAYIELCNSSDLSMNFYNVTGGSNGGYNFYSNTTLGLRQDKTGLVIANQGLQISNSVTSAIFQTVGTGVNGILNLMDGSGNGGYSNSYGIGVYTTKMSGGSNGSLVTYQTIFPTGSMVLQSGGTFVNNGFSLETTNTNGARFTGGAGYGTIGTVAINTSTNSTTGGSLIAATYFTKVVPIDGFGNLGAPLSEANTTTTGTTSTITQTWTNNPLATGGYRVYIGTATNAENLWVFVAAGTTTYTYTGSGATSGAISTLDKTNLANISSAGLGTFTGVNVGSLAGNKINITTGTNGSVGIATLASGTVTVSTTAVTASSLIFVVYNTPSGTLASGLAAPSGSIIAGTSFVINSETTAGAVNTLDNSTVRWWIIN